MSFFFGQLVNKNLLCLMLFFLIMGAQIGNCQEPDYFASFRRTIRVYIRKAMEESHKDAVDLSRNELSKTKNISKDDIKFIGIREVNDGWHVVFSIKGAPPGCLVTMYVSGDKKNVRFVPSLR